MRLADDEARRRFEQARMARLATADGDGHPHIVPVTFAVRGDALVLAVDHKPKRHRDLKRLRNIAANSSVSALADVYDEDWSRLWWARADGTARVLDGAAGADPLARLVAKYPQYAERPPEGPVIEITVRRWSGWAYAGSDGSRPAASSTEA